MGGAPERWGSGEKLYVCLYDTLLYSKCAVDWSNSLVADRGDTQHVPLGGLNVGIKGIIRDHFGLKIQKGTSHGILELLCQQSLNHRGGGEEITEWRARPGQAESQSMGSLRVRQSHRRSAEAGDEASQRPHTQSSDTRSLALASQPPPRPLPPAPSPAPLFTPPLRPLLPLPYPSSDSCRLGSTALLLRGCRDP